MPRPSALAALLLLAPAAAPAAQDAAAVGDARMEAFDTAGAAAAYRDGLARDSTSVALLWRLSRALSNRAIETSGRSGDAALHREAVGLARRAVELGPRTARAHSTLAGAVGRLAMFEGGRRKVELAREVRRSAERAIALDPEEFAGYTILGIWHREIATLNPLLRGVARAVFGGLPDASLADSRHNLERAVELAPWAITPRVELAKTFLEMDREREARAQLDAAHRLRPLEGLDRQKLAEARALRADLGS